MLIISGEADDELELPVLYANMRNIPTPAYRAQHGQAVQVVSSKAIIPVASTKIASHATYFWISMPSS